jgi:hypothetical protein
MGFEQVGCKRVPQRVRVKMIEIRGASNRLIQLAPDRAIAEAAATLVDEQRIMFFGDLLPPPGAFRKIGLDGSSGRSAKRHDPFFSSLTPHPDDPLRKIEIPEIERHQLSNPKSRRVEQLDRSPIATPGGGIRKPVEQLFDGIAVGDLRRPLNIVRVGHGFGRVGLDRAF